MKVVLAPDSFKESMSAATAADVMKRGVLAVFPDADCVECPLADGGEGTGVILARSLDAVSHVVKVGGALGEPVGAAFALARNGTAIMDVASVVGLGLTRSEDRDIMSATTRGVGELMTAALDAGATRLVIGLGGSCTNDGGAGMLAALGARLLDIDGRICNPTPAELPEVATVDLAPLLAKFPLVRTPSQLASSVRDATIDIACDVDSPLLGATGASVVFGPQKGANAADVKELDQALGHWASVLISAFSELGESSDYRWTPGAGAAGGLGFALMMLGARPRRGIELVIEATGLDTEIAEADLVLTGEGSFDAQSLTGKVPWGVAHAARRHHVPVIGFAGRVAAASDDLLVFPIVPGPVRLNDALADGAANLKDAVERVMRVLADSGSWRRDEIGALAARRGQSV